MDQFFVFMLFLFFSIILQSRAVSKETFEQEAARLTYSNPKYVQNVSIFTARHDRRSPYLTTMNGTSLQPWGDNVTLVLSYENTKLRTAAIKLDFKICDILKHVWAKQWVESYSDVKLACPVAAGTYHFVEVELPPKNFPIPILMGDYRSKLQFVKTDTKERILEVDIKLKFRG